VAIPENSVGIVETKYYTFAEPPNEMELECGRKLGPITLAYETYGELSPKKDNAILIAHALSGDAHAAGYHSPDDEKPGWWDIMIGPGKAFDTNKYFVICSNVIGGCKGSTGPSSINPQTGRPYGLQFPVVTIRDMVNAQKALIDYLGIERLLCVAGGSMGGMQVLQWTVSYPDMVRLAIPIATTARLSAQAIAFNEVGRQAIMSDPDWMGGDYYGKAIPHRGLAIARMIGHITYLSDKSMHQKFARRLQGKDEYGYDFVTDFQVESYLHYKGDSFVKRFDANSYLYITKAMDYFDLAQGYESLKDAFAGVKAKFLVISFSSDWLFPSYQSREIVTALRQNNIDVIYTEIQTDYGHDAFLLESEQLTNLISNFLEHGRNRA
jgi:homoserine O-acetyltransferase